MPTATSSSRLAPLLAEARADADSRAAALVARELPRGQDALVLCGAGYFGRLLLKGLRDNGVAPLAFADNNVALQGGSVDGLRVLSVEGAVAELPHATFVVTAFSPAALSAQLRRLGIAPAGSRALVHANPRTLLPQSWMNRPSAVLDEAEEVLAAAELWADDESRAEYEHVVRSYLLLDPPTRKAGSVADTYFPPGLITLGGHERYVDCGAFDGDSLKDFLVRTNNRFDRIDAMEPDPQNLEKLKRFIETLPGGVRERVHVHPFAVGAGPATLRFRAGEGLASTITEEGELEVRCVALDEELAGVSPTFIKMDIEGAEPEAIRGAARIIAADAPTLAIVLYHRTSDLWKIPLSLRALRPDYRLYLRRYAEECWETVCYAMRADG
jgi:FkbM family methyltransferase